jgi:hypothetical protein
VDRRRTPQAHLVAAGPRCSQTRGAGRGESVLECCWWSPRVDGFGSRRCRGGFFFGDRGCFCDRGCFSNRGCFCDRGCFSNRGCFCDHALIVAHASHNHRRGLVAVEEPDGDDREHKGPQQAPQREQQSVHER